MGEMPGESKILTPFSSPRQHCYAIKFFPLPICPVSVNRDLPQAPVQIARYGGADVLCDDGPGWRERTADRRPRSDKGFETAHGAGTNL